MAEITEAEYRADWEDIKGRMANLDEKVEKILGLVTALASTDSGEVVEGEEVVATEEPEHKEEHKEEDHKKTEGIRFI